MNFKLKNFGFTMIELVIVIVLMTIIAGGMYVLWPDSTVNLEAQTSLLASDIRYTQSLAMAKGNPYRLVITTNTRSYQILDANSTAVLMPSASTTTTLGQGISFGAITNLPGNLISFRSQGTPYIDANATNLLTTSATINLISSRSNTTKTITIAPRTGGVTP